MNKEEKFLAYLNALKTKSNSGLLEGVINGFKTLVEYRVDGSISERQVDIMESDDGILDETPERSGGYTVADVKKMTFEEILEWNGLTLSAFEERVKDFHPVEVNEDIAYWVDQVERNADDYDSVYGNDVPFDASSEDSVLTEVGEGEVKAKLNPMLLRKIDDAIEKSIQKMSLMIDRNKLVRNQAEKTQYLKNMRGQKWRDELISVGVDPSTMKGLIPALGESIDTANTSLLESINYLKVSILESVSAPKFNEDPIIPNALSLISSYPSSVKFTDKDSFDSFLKKQNYFSASFSHCFYSVDEMNEFRKTFTPVNDDCVILRETGRLLVAVWDDINSIGYIIPSDNKPEN